MGAVVGVWVEALLVVIILILLGIILFFGGITRTREPSRAVDSLRNEVKRLQEANEAIRRGWGVGTKTRTRRFGDLFGLVRELEELRCAVDGSKVCQRVLTQKYDIAPGAELLERILSERPEMDPTAKQKLANELLVGEVGRIILRNLDAGALLEQAASDAGVPLAVVRGLVKRLQALGYLDNRMKLTERGRKPWSETPQRSMLSEI